MARIHILLSEEEKARYRLAAARSGMSLGAWLRAAAEDKLASTGGERFRSPEELDAFLDACDRRRGKGSEPDWEEWKERIEASKVRGLPRP